MFFRYTLFLPILLSLGLSLTLSTVQAQTSTQRVVSLAPHITEMLFSAGAGDKVVGVVAYSDYPKAALEIASVGSYHAINIEKVIQLNPDLIIAWKTGNRLKDIEKLQQLGFKIIYSEPYKLSDIPKEIRLFGEILNTQTTANAVAERLDKQLENLAKSYASKSKVKVFYQVWNAPIITINGQQFISQAMQLCGGENVFADLPTLASEVSIESVVTQNPQVILLGGAKNVQQAWLKEWQKWTTIQAVKNQQVYLLNADTFQRSTERLIDGIDGLCKTIDQAR